MLIYFYLCILIIIFNLYYFSAKPAFMFAGAFSIYFLLFSIFVTASTFIYFFWSDLSVIQLVSVWFTCKSISYTQCACLYTAMNHCITQRLLSLHHRKRGREREGDYITSLFAPFSLWKTPELQLNPSERNTSSVIFRRSRRPPAHHPLPLQPLGNGCLATAADWVSKVKKGSGTGWRNQITPIDHPLCELRWETKKRLQKNLSHAFMSEWGVITHSNTQRVAGLFGCTENHPISTFCCSIEII